MEKDNPLKQAIKYRKLITRLKKPIVDVSVERYLTANDGGLNKRINPRIRKYPIQLESEEKMTIKGILRG
jgi:hypothetical protein